MASITAPATDRARTARGWRKRARTALTSAIRQGATMVSAARHRYRRPALTIGSFASLDAAAWHTFGLGAGLLVLGLLGLVLEMLGGDE